MKRLHLALLILLALVARVAVAEEAAPAPAAPDKPAAAEAATPAAAEAATPAAAEAATPAAAEAAAPAAAPACTECHDGIDRPAFEASAHGGKDNAACQKCHGTFAVTSDGHDAPGPVDCGRCHAESSKAYDAGLHAVKKDDGTPRATCQKCHAPHAVPRLTKIQPGEKKLVMEGMCKVCHEKEVGAYTDGRHGRSSNVEVATCTDCHGGHEMRRKDDPASRTYRLNIATTCAACHVKKNGNALSPESKKAVSDYFGSIHGLAMVESGLLVSATCADCHGAHAIADPSSPGSPVARANVPDTCGKCHQGVTRVYKESVHGREIAKGNVDVPVCIDCHRSNQIRSHYDPTSATYATHVSETCLRCHADQATIKKYEFPGLRAETYNQSYHGAASKLGDTTVANCASCHTSHDIRASTDPQSSTHPARLAATCGKCHTTDNPSTSMLSGKIHVETARQSHWITGLVEKVYMGLIAGTLGFFAFFILIDLRRHFRNRGKH